MGISGGVDSAVAAYLLREQGYDVTGYTMTLKGTPIKYEDAAITADSLGIELLTVDVSERFEREIMARFADEYRAGLTPSPCPACNMIKFGIAEAFPDGIESRVATGHYAVADKNGLYCSPHAKDQAYFLARLSTDTVRRLILPLGMTGKKEVRAIAAKAGLHVSDKPESQDICFIGGGDYRVFLRERGLAGGGGPVVDTSGKVVDSHDGYYNFTIGQRYRLGGTAGRLYVVSTDPLTRTVTVGEESSLYSTEITAADVNMLAAADPGAEEVYAKIRSRDSFHAVSALSVEGGELRLAFAEPVRAVTPGQLAVVYKRENGLMRVCASAWIKEAVL